MNVVVIIMIFVRTIDEKLFIIVLIVLWKVMVIVLLVKHHHHLIVYKAYAEIDRLILEKFVIQAEIWDVDIINDVLVAKSVSQFQFVEME